MTMPGQSNQRLILLELNELCPPLVEQFIGEGLLPNFKRLRDASQTFITHTSEEVLEPWIQWVTVHTGVPLSEHGIKDLDEAEKLKHNAFWDGLHEDNVLLISPMNVKFRRHNQSLFMPDPWAASQAPSAELDPFYKFVRATVNNHARTDHLELKDAAGAVRFLLGHGINLDTIAAALRQLLAERMGGRDVKWRRATLLDRLLWDVFEYFWRGPRRPRVGIFFSNATAHYQHKYWSHHDPSQFTLKPDAAALETYGNAIRFGYQAHDRLIGRAMSLAGKGTAVALCTALSQQPMFDYEVRGGKQMFLVKDFAKLLSALGTLATGQTEALMAEESWLHFATAERRRRRISKNLSRQDCGRPRIIQTARFRRQIIHYWLRRVYQRSGREYDFRELDGHLNTVQCALPADGYRDHGQTSPGRHILDDVGPPGVRRNPAGACRCAAAHSSTEQA